MNSGIMVAPNGARLKYDEHKKLPLVIEQIVKTAKKSEEVGAQAIHLHVRDNNLDHVLDVKKYKETINAIKKECSKDFIIQATTESVGKYTPQEMISLIKELRPQASSIAIKELLPSIDNINELKDARDFYKFAVDENIGIQHILYSSDDLKKFHKLLDQGIIKGEEHSILFVLGRYSKGEQSSTSDLIPYLQTLKELNLENITNWMVCAFGQKEIPSLVVASILGGHCRIGFENSRLKPNGEKAKDNESQVKILRKQLELLSIKKVDNNKMKRILGIFR
jgi:uncharacterized protein (DUF849 family)